MLTNLILTGLALALLLAIVNLWRLHQLNSRMTASLGGASSDSLEHKLIAYLKQVEAVDSELRTLTKSYKELTTMTGLASQKISVVRFNPFDDTGGDQSFALAVLDSHDSGYILTSIHGRGGTRVYVKPIDYGKSKYALSQEEKQAYEQAAKRVPKI